MILNIKNYFENLDPKKIGLSNKVIVSSITKLGMGTGNLNYMVEANRKKYVFRMNIEPKYKDKSKKEFASLKLIEKYDIGPKALLFEPKNTDFDSSFIILTYLEGVPSNKIKPFMDDKMIKNLAKLMAKHHSIKIFGKLKGLRKGSGTKGYRYSFNKTKKIYLDYIFRYIKSLNLRKMLSETYSNLGNSIPKTNYKPDYILSQGDYCAQNVIVNKDQYRIVDFEYLGLDDRASIIAHFFSDFHIPLNEKQKNIFLNEYRKFLDVDIKKLKNKIENWLPQMRFDIFLWSIWFVLRIKNKDFHKKFLANTKIEGHLRYMKKEFNRCLKFGIIDKKWKDFDIISEVMK